MRSLALAGLWLLVPSLLWAGTITLDFGKPVSLVTTPGQDAAMHRLVADLNSQRVAQGLPFYTVEQWLESILSAAIQGFFAQVQREAGQAQRVAEACGAFQALAKDVQQQIVTALGGKSPCPQ